MKYLENIKHTLFPYQDRDMENVIHALQTYRKVCFQAQTSYGKTFSFCTVAKWFNINHKKKILILCHKEELVEQASNTCIMLGLTTEKIVSGNRRYHYNADVYIGMEKTVSNRLDKNRNFLKNVGMIIIDECHDGHFDSHIEYFKEQLILGFTATPIRDKKLTYWKCGRCNSTSNEEDNCCGREMNEWSKPFTMSMLFDTLVIGASTDELIEFGSIVRDQYFIEKTNNLDDLKTDTDGEFTKESQNAVYATEESVFNCLLNYEKHCKGKKTIIFNPSTKVNKMIYQQFKDAGYNIKLYDSVNDKEDSRKKIVQWFEDNEDAILCNVACFTTGFDSKEVQAVILNRAIGSLSLYLQCLGRGARASQKIYKDYFITIDGGGNVERHQKWSSPRDWCKIFYEGIGKDTAKKENVTSIAICELCANYYPRSSGECDVCGHKAPTKEKKERPISESVLVPLEPMPPPNATRIIEYTIRREKNIHFAFNLTYNYMVDMFSSWDVPVAQYLSNKRDGRLEANVTEKIRKVYFALIGNEYFKKDSNRTLKYVVKKCLEKLDKHYNLTNLAE